MHPSHLQLPADCGLRLVQISVGVPEAFQLFYATGWQQATVLYRVLPRTGQAPVAAQVQPDLLLACSAMPCPCFTSGLQAGHHRSRCHCSQHEHKNPPGLLPGAPSGVTLG